GVAEPNRARADAFTAGEGLVVGADPPPGSCGAFPKPHSLAGTSGLPALGSAGAAPGPPPPPPPPVPPPAAAAEPCTPASGGGARREGGGPVTGSRVRGLRKGSAAARSPPSPGRAGGLAVPGEASTKLSPGLSDMGPRLESAAAGLETSWMVAGSVPRGKAG